jgi:hypothetical protein
MIMALNVEWAELANSPRIFLLLWADAIKKEIRNLSNHSLEFFYP